MNQATEALLMPLVGMGELALCMQCDVLSTAGNKQDGQAHFTCVQSGLEQDTGVLGVEV